MKRLKVFIVISLTSSLLFSLTGQHLSAYIDYMNRFYVFDGGKSTMIDHLKPQNYKIGGNHILYTSGQGYLMMYYNEEVAMLERAGVSKYFVTDYLAAYSLYEKLKVVYKGKIIQLSSRCINYDVADSLIAFYDKNLESVNIFYHGEIFEIESGLIGFPILKWSSGKNIVAYVTQRNKDFKIWYQGEIHLIDRNVDNTHFKAGRDIVAYKDPLEQNFKAFYKGEVYTIDEFTPLSYQVGNEFIAYVDHMGEFKVFSDGEVSTVSPNTPDSYLAEDNVLAFVENTLFQAWHKGQIVDIEGYKPDVYRIDQNTIAYLDNSNRIFIYSEGKRKYLANEFVTDFNIYRDLIHMNVRSNRNIIYYNDKFYEGDSFYK